jgi:hypothetical protein
MNNVFGLNFFVFCIGVLAIVLYLTKEIRDEAFFVSGGTIVQIESTEGFDNTGALTQLQSTRAVSQKEQDIDKKIYDNLTRQGIMNMTESGYKGSDYANVGSNY